MSSRAKHDVQSTGKAVVPVPFRFFPASTSNPSSVDDPGGAVASVVRNSEAGEWLVTFRDSYSRFLGAQVTIQISADDTDLHGQCGDYDASAKTLIVRALTATTQTDIAADANNSVMVTAWFQDSNVTQ